MPEHRALSQEAVSAIEMASPTAWLDDLPLDRAIRTLSQSSPASLSLVTQTYVAAARPSTPTIWGMASNSDDAKLDRLVAAMAAFHAGSTAGGGGLAVASPLNTQLAELAPPV